MNYFSFFNTFLAVYTTGSMAKAAAILNLSQPAITRQIKSLEQKLQRKLFVPEGRGIKPTLYARLLAERIEAPLSALSDVINEHQAGAGGKVIIGGEDTILKKYIVPKLGIFYDSNIQVVLNPLFKHDVINYFAKNQFDFVITAESLPHRMKSFDLISSETLHIVCSEKTAQSLNTEALATGDYTALATSKWITYDEDAYLSQRFFQSVFSNEFPYQADFVSYNYETSLEAILEHDLLATLPTCIVHEHLVNGQLVDLFPNHRCQDFDVKLLFKASLISFPTLARSREILLAK